MWTRIVSFTALPLTLQAKVSPRASSSAARTPSGSLWSQVDCCGCRLQRTRRPDEHAVVNRLSSADRRHPLRQT
jgi:hypothetical protein